MNTTINISLPKSMLEAAKRVMKAKHYNSMSELIRDSLRKTIQEEDPNEISVNGFPRWFEDEVLAAEANPTDDGKAWETEEDIHQYFRDLRREIDEEKKHAKD